MILKYPKIIIPLHNIHFIPSCSREIWTLFSHNVLILNIKSETII